jgi:hypothetical protein
MQLGKHKNLGTSEHCQMHPVQSICGQSRVLSGGEQAASPHPTQSHPNRLIPSRAPCRPQKRLRKSAARLPKRAQRGEHSLLPLSIQTTGRFSGYAGPKNNTLLQATTVHRPFPLSMQMPGHFRENLRSSIRCTTVAALIAEVKCKIICIYNATYCYLHLQSRLKLL